MNENFRASQFLHLDPPAMLDWLHAKPRQITSETRCISIFFISVGIPDKIAFIILGDKLLSLLFHLVIQ
jgi:hypothetical protein